MKALKVLLFVAVLSAMASMSCKKNDISSSFDKSYNTWLSYKKKVNNTYKYVAVHDDAESAYSETTITVVQGNITARDFVSYQYEYNPDSNATTKTFTDEWHETANSLNTHSVDGSPLYTLDDVYYRAQNIWLMADKAKNVITFQTNNNGIISAAGYTPNSCVNDCFIGINIKSITN